MLAEPLPSCLTTVEYALDYFYRYPYAVCTISAEATVHNQNTRYLFCSKTMPKPTSLIPNERKKSN